MSPLERINQYVSAYNSAREEYGKSGSDGDLQRAIQMGQLAVRDASEELEQEQQQKKTLSDTQRSHYKYVVKTIGEFLKNPKAAATSVQAKAGKTGKDVDEIKSKDWFASPIPDLTFNDIAGLRDVKDQFLINVVAPLDSRFSGIYRKYRGEECGVQMLLYGPPGTGKTHIVKCLAGQLGCKIAVVQIKDVMANLVGDGAKIIAEIFEQAKKYDRCIIFFDEIDAIASSREGEDSRHTKEQLTTLLTNMDGFTSKAKPGQLRIVIAATNRPAALDSAVKRGGRFDTQIYVPLPDVEARKTLIARALGKDTSIKKRVDVPCADDVTIDWLAERFEGFAGADIKSVCRQAVGRPMEREIRALYAKKAISDCVKREDFEYVFQRYINSITDEMLMEFDAYSMNMTYNTEEYILHKCEAVILALKKGVKVEKYVLRWFKWHYDSGFVEKVYGNKHDLSFLKEKLQSI